MNEPELITAAALTGCIDHTQLNPEAGKAAIKQMAAEAIKYGFGAVCVHPCHVRLLAGLLASHSSKVCSVVGFPFGANHTAVKRAEAVQAIEDGAVELDMVINLSAALENDTAYLKRDVEAVLDVCRGAAGPVTLKVILETAALPRTAKIMLCELLGQVGVDFLKTSTGLHAAGGATIEDVRLLCRYGSGCKVKAAGGIRNLQALLAMRNAGAERIGTSAGVAIMAELAGNR